MTTAAELLASLTNSEEEKVLIIDNDLRTINIPKNITALGVEADDDVHRLYFRMPRMYGDTDLSTFNIRINYKNARGDGDVYVVTDKNVLPTSITFSWLVGPNAFVELGTVKFIVCLKDSDADGTILREFNTTVAVLPVLEGLEVDTEPLEGELQDILEQLLSLTDEKVSEVADAGLEQIEKVQQESLKQQDNIAQKGVEVLATIPEDYQTTFKMIDNADRTKADAIICTAEGDSILVDNSSDDHVRGLKLYGKTSQIRTTGKNLLPNPASGFGTRNGVTFTELSDGRIGVVGNATANTTLVFCSFSPGERTPIPAGTYTISGSSGAYAYLSIFIYADQETEDIFMSNASLANGRTWTFTLENDAYYGAYIYVGNGKTPNETLSPQLEAGSVVTAFEKYSGGVASPRPELPQQFSTAGDSGTIGVWMTGKNLLRDVDFPATSTAKGITCDYEGNGIFHIYGTFNGIDGGFQLSTTDLNIPIDPNSEYTLSAKLLSGQPPDDYHPYIGAGSDTVTMKNWVAANIDPNTPIGVTQSTTAHARSAVKDATRIKRFWIYGYNGELVPYTADFRIQVWLEKGRVSTEFEPYTETRMTVNTPNGLLGIPVSYGGNYTDENGQQWVCDEIDLERGVLIQRLNTRVFTGTEVFGDYMSDNGAITSALWHKPDTKFLCTHAIQWDAMTWANDKYISFNADKFNVSSIDELATLLAEWNAAGNPLTVLYVRREPVETALTAEEIESFRAMRTNYPNTRVFTDSTAGMDLKYNADTKTYLDKLPKATDEQVQTFVDAWLEAHFASAEGVSF